MRDRVGLAVAYCARLRTPNRRQALFRRHAAGRTGAGQRTARLMLTASVAGRVREGAGNP